MDRNRTRASAERRARVGAIAVACGLVAACDAQGKAVPVALELPVAVDPEGMAFYKTNVVRGFVAEGSPEERKWTPVASAEVSLVGWRDEPRIVRTLTDARGEFVLGFEGPAWRFYLAARRRGFRRTGRFVSLPRAPFLEPVGVLLLVPDAPVRGRCVDWDKRPIAGAEIRAFQEHEPAPWNSPVTRSGDDGSFCLEQCPEGDFVVTATREGRVPTFHRRGAADTDELELLLAPEVRLPGKVVDDAGAPVAGARVSVRENVDFTPIPPSAATTDSDGRFELRGLRSPGSWWYGSVSKPGMQTLALRGVDAAALERIVLERKRLLEVALRPDARGRTPSIDLAHVEWADARFARQSGGGRLGDFEVDGGVLRATWIGGRRDPFVHFRVSARSTTGAWAASEWREAPEADGSTIRTEIAFPPTGRVGGRVNVGGNPVGGLGARVRISVRQDSLVEPFLERAAVCGLVGAFDRYGLPQHSAIVRVDSKEWFGGAPASIGVSSNPMLSYVSLDARPAARIRGTLRTASGPLRWPVGVAAFAVDGAGGSTSAEPAAWTASDLDGRFVLAPLEAGEYVVCPDASLSPRVLPGPYAPSPPSAAGWPWRVTVEAGGTGRIDVEFPQPR